MKEKRLTFSAVIVVTFILLLSFSSIFAAQEIIGDVNGDGSVNSSDMALMKRFLLGTVTDLPVDDEMWVADTNGDDSINSTDYALLKRYILGTIDKFPKESALTTPPQTTPPQTTPPQTTQPQLTPVKTDAYPDWDKERSSYATYTGSGYTGGASLLDPTPPDKEITALNPEDYNSYGIAAALAGAYLEVTGEKGSTVVFVNDLYPEGAPGALDLCPTSFDKIGDMLAGKIDISWHLVAAPVTGNVSYRIKEGTTIAWFAIQVRDHKYPVLKMEYYKDGEWINMEKMPWNHFVGRDIDTTTPKIRITDIRGYVLEDVVDSIPGHNEATGEAYIVPGSVQFPD